jgi:hypothetical protein
MEKLPAKKITIVLDACFSGNSQTGMLVKNVSPIILEAVNPVQSIKNATIFSSADKGQVSTWFPEKRHGLFTYFFLKGLQGKADKNYDKRITVKELEKYLKDNVSWKARRIANKEQTPVIITSDENWELAYLR